MDFWNLYYRLLRYRLTVREMNYLIWKFYNHKSYKQIAYLDGRKIGGTAVSMVITNAYKKIKMNFRKS